MAKSRSKAARPTWEGHLRLSLVTCPVALLHRDRAQRRRALQPDQSQDQQSHPHADGRCRAPASAVERAGLVRGFEVSKNKYILLDKEELDAVKLESTRIIDIEEFVDAVGDRPHLLGRALLSRAGRQDRHRGLRGDPGGDEEAGARWRWAAWCCISASGRARSSRATAASCSRPCARTTRSAAAPGCSNRQPAQARRGHARHRREDHRPAGRQVRSQPVQGSLRGRAARADRAQEEGQADRGRGARGERRQGRRPDGRAAQQPEGRGGGRRPRAKRAKTARKRAA